MLLRARDLLARQRAQLLNALRGHLAEHGVVAPQGLLVKQPWLKEIDTRAFNGSAQIRRLGWRDLKTTRVWAPRLMAVEREFEGANSLGLDRFVWLKQPERSRPRHGELEIIQYHWNVACVLLAAALIRAIGAQHSDARCLDRAADFELSALPPVVGPLSFEPKRPRRKGAGSSFVDWEPLAPVKN